MNVTYITFFITRLLNKSVVLTATLLISACSSTENVNDEAAIKAEIYQHTAALNACKNKANAIAQNASLTQSAPQFINAGKSFRACVKYDNKTLSEALTSLEMQLYVSSVLNFIKGGDIKNAHHMVARFKQRFPQQDFYFANYTSFLDTAEALLTPAVITPQLLATLNISTALRQELLRNQYWLKH